jgi:[ribosomal protein S5]-alanine N-acetyltransferase
VPSLELVPIPTDISAADVGRVFGNELPFVRDVVAATLAWYAREPRGAPWLGYLAGDGATRRMVGTCSFKTAPRGGVVEIAYCTFPGLEGRGYATAMASALLRIARAHGVARVSAQTAPEPGASPRILEKLGFTRAGEALDEDIGLAWVWERPAAEAVLDGNGS